MKTLRLFPLLLILLASSCSGSDNVKKTIFIDGIQIRVEIADTQEKRRVGLMNRNSLKENEGMLFVFEEEQKMSFWMKNTTIPLSIAYISKSGIIKEIHDMSPLSERPVYSSTSVLYALEMNQGFFEKNGIKEGDALQF